MELYQWLDQTVKQIQVQVGVEQLLQRILHLKIKLQEEQVHKAELEHRVQQLEQSRVELELGCVQ